MCKHGSIACCCLYTGWHRSISGPSISSIKSLIVATGKQFFFIHDESTLDVAFLLSSVLDILAWADFLFEYNPLF
jgi:hypothetical protein